MADNAHGQGFAIKAGIKILILFFFLLQAEELYLYAEQKTLLLGEEGNWPPVTYEKSGKASGGLSFEIMTEIFRRLDVPFEIELYPQNRLLIQVKEGLLDAVTLISKNSARDSFLVFTDTIIETSGYVYYDPGRRQPLEWKSFSDFSQYRVGIVMGHNYGDDFSSAVVSGKFNIEEVATVEQNIRKLLLGRVDFILAKKFEAEDFLHKNPQYKNSVKAMGKPYHSYSYSMGFSRKSGFIHLIPGINKVVSDMKKDGTMENIKEKYLF